LPRGNGLRDHLLAEVVVPNFVAPHPPTPSPREFGQRLIRWKRL